MKSKEQELPPCNVVKDDRGDQFADPTVFWIDECITSVIYWMNVIVGQTEIRPAEAPVYHNPVRLRLT